MKIAYDDEYKTVALSAEADAVKQLKIDGVVYNCPTGIQGANNPGPINSIEQAQTSGAVFRFEVKADGVLYVISKLTYNKNYYVWEGDQNDVTISNAAPIAYSLVAFNATDGTRYGYTLPSVADNFGYYDVDNDTEYQTEGTVKDYLKKANGDKIKWEDYEAEGENGELHTYVANYPFKDGESLQSKDAVGNDGYLQKSPAITTKQLKQVTDIDKTWISGNALGVIAFPVGVAAGTEKTLYNVNACGSKITCDGFVFIKGATEVGTVEGTKDESTAVKNITVDELDTNAPIYNLQGQRVGEGYKGICIQNGKKFIVK